MLLPEFRFSGLDEPDLPKGFHLRNYRAGDEGGFYDLMSRAGFGSWNDQRLQSWISRIPPKCWFMICSPTDEIVASAMGLHNHTDYQPFGGEIGWVAVEPEQRRKGLGKAVSLAVTRRLITAGYENIHLYSEDFRAAALRLYLELGFQPYLYAPDMPDRWRQVCETIAWPFTPEEWQSQ